MNAVRIWFKKDKQSKYISHLDLNRVMQRAVNMAKLPIWYTQGFHPHPFITFALPLSLGMSSVEDAVDMKFTQDIDKDYVIESLNKALPEGIEILDITTPVMKPKEIEYAQFDIDLYDDNKTSENLKECIDNILSREEIIVKKKTKSGVKEIDIKPAIKRIQYKIKDDKKVNLDIVIKSGSNININPILLIRALNEYYSLSLIYEITRKRLLNKN
ncbi:MAG: TIGR03936 family radical SAM-associated protein, partial [Clostridia bacterium]|nr:TIGR03936 family radical SAM-associated protein [Clostridia bacterium]